MIFAIWVSWNNTPNNCYVKHPNTGWMVEPAIVTLFCILLTRKLLVVVPCKQFFYFNRFIKILAIEGLLYWPLVWSVSWPFLIAYTHLYERLCPLVCPGLSVFVSTCLRWKCKNAHLGCCRHDLRFTGPTMRNISILCDISFSLLHREKSIYGCLSTFFQFIRHRHSTSSFQSEKHPCVKVSNQCDRVWTYFL